MEQYESLEKSAMLVLRSYLKSDLSEVYSISKTLTWIRDCVNDGVSLTLMPIQRAAPQL